MKTLKKLPFVMAFALAAFAGACSDIDLSPRRTDDKPSPVILPPPGAASPDNPVEPDSVTIG